MKSTVIVFLSLLIQGILAAQPGNQPPGYPVAISQTYTFQLEVVDSQGRAAVRYSTVENPGASSFLQVRRIALEDADLKFYIDLQKKEKDFSYSLEFFLKKEEDTEWAPVQRQLDDDYSAISAEGGLKTITCEDALAYDLDFGRTYLILLRLALQGVVYIDCENPPSFTIRQYWPHPAGVAAGAVLIGLGQVSKRDSDNSYKRYEESWQAYQQSHGDIAFKEAAKPFFEDAKEKDRIHRRLTYAGIAVIGLDAIWLAYRWLKFRKDSKYFNRYKQYCPEKNETVFVSPVHIRPATPDIPRAIGFKMTFQF